VVFEKGGDDYINANNSKQYKFIKKNIQQRCVWHHFLFSYTLYDCM